MGAPCLLTCQLFGSHVGVTIGAGGEKGTQCGAPAPKTALAKTNSNISRGRRQAQREQQRSSVSCDPRGIQVFCAQEIHTWDQSACRELKTPFTPRQNRLCRQRRRLPFKEERQVWLSTMGGGKGSSEE